LEDFFKLPLSEFWQKYDPTFVASEKGTEEEERSIPGGRYGCAQFVKACGP